MKRIISNSVIASALMLIFTACGGGGGGSSSTTTTPPVSPNTISFSGIAVDGYISGATACLDTNINGTCDSGEPTTPTLADGTFSFTNVEVKDDVLMPVIITGGIDTATGELFKGEMKNIVNTKDVTTGSRIRVSPLTNLVAESFLSSSDKSSTQLRQIKANVATSLGLTVAKVDADPMLDKEVFAKAQEIQQVKELVLTSAAKSAGVVKGTVEYDVLEQNIAKAIASSAQENTILTPSDVISKLEVIDNTVDIPTNEKEFIALQITEIKSSLANMVADTTVVSTVATLNAQQSDLEDDVEVATTNIENATEGSTITVVEIETPICAQVISYATNPTTQECQMFSTPCDVPSGWIACQKDATPLVTTISTPPAPPAL